MNLFERHGHRFAEIVLQGNPNGITRSEAFRRALHFEEIEMILDPFYRGTGHRVAVLFFEQGYNNRMIAAGMCPVCAKHPVASGRETCVDCSH